MRRSTAFAIVMSFVVWAGPSPVEGFDDVEIETTRLTDGVFLLAGAGGNIGVSVGRDGVLLVDDQFAPLTDKIRAAVGKLTDKPIRFVVNTHWHGDHTGGNENLGKAGAVILAHDNVRERMSVEQFIEAFDRRVPASPEVALPVVTFSDTVTFHYNDEEIHVAHVATAHTDGDSFVRFRRADVLHLGDVYWNGSYPFIDLSSGGSIDGLISAVETALQQAGADSRIIPGHGAVSGRQELVAYRDLLIDSRSRILALLRAGKSLDEVLAEKPTADFDEAWGSGFVSPEAFTTSVYNSLTP